MPGYKTDARTIRALADLPLLPAFDATALVIDVSGARAGLVMVTYAQGTTKGAAAYPLMRILGGASPTSLVGLPVEDASAPVNRAGIGLQTDVRVGLKAFRDAESAPQGYLVIFPSVKYVQFQFSEVGGGLIPGQALVQLALELDH